MALQQIQGDSLVYPRIPSIFIVPAFSSDSLIDASGEKAAFCGRVFFPSRTGTKNISRVQFMFGSVTKTGGSALTVSLQDISLTSGPPIQPDETQDQTVAIANVDASFASNTWYRTGTFSATRTVANGDLLAVVIEYDGAGRLGSDSVVIRGFQPSSSNSTYALHQTINSLKTGGSWGLLASMPNIILEFDDGTFGSFYGSIVYSAYTGNTYNSSTAGADEYATVINFPFSCKVDGLWALVNPGSSSANFDLVLYSGTTALQSVSVDANSLMASSPRFIRVPIPETTLDINTDYYISVKPTTTNNLTAYSVDVSDANHWTIMDGGTAVQYSTRVDLGSWAAKTTTRRLLAGVCISSLDDGVSGGGSSTYIFPCFD